MKHKIPKEKLYSLYVVGGLTMKEIAEILGVGVGTVHRHIHEEDINIRKRPEHSWNSGKTYKDDDRILAKEKHPRYIDGRTYPSDFDYIKKLVLPCRCELCNGEAVLLHHIDKNKHNNELTNLQPLCSSCHAVLHNKERKSFINLLRARGIDTSKYE